MSGIHLFVSEEFKNEKGLPARQRVDNAWLYWREFDSEKILRVNEDGRVLELTTGDPKEPASYQNEFVTKEGVTADVAYNTEPGQLAESDITARLTSIKVVQSLSATLARHGPLFVPPGRTKKQIKILPLGEIRLPRYRPRGNDIMIVPQVPLVNDPSDHNGIHRKWGEQWKAKAPARRELRFLAPGATLDKFESVAGDAAGDVSPPVFQGPTFTGSTGSQDPARWSPGAVVRSTTGASRA